jgi:hypothetical protein
MKVYIGVELDEEKARRLAELLSQGVEEVNQEPPKLVVEGENISSFQERGDSP